MLFILVLGLVQGSVSGGREQESITMPALGHRFVLGSLYDINSGKIIPGSLWSQDSLKKNIITRIDQRTEYKTSQATSMKQKMTALNLDLEIHVTILWLIDVYGSAQFVKRESNTNYEGVFAAKYRTNTHWEALSMDHLSEVDFKHVLNDTEATHVVYQIIYGAEAVIEYTETIERGESTKQAGGEICRVDASVCASHSIQSMHKPDASGLKVRYFGDIPISISPKNVTEAKDIYQNFPKLVQKDIAVPIEVFLYPIAKLGDTSGKVANSLPVQLISEMEDILDGAQQMKRSLFDIMEQIGELHAADALGQLKEPVKECRSLLVLFEDLYKKRMAEVILKVRRGGEAIGIYETLLAVQESPFHLPRVKEWVRNRERDLGILSEVLRSFPDHVAFGSESLESAKASVAEYTLSYAIEIGQSSDKLLDKMKKFVRLWGYKMNGEVTETAIHLPRLRKQFKTLQTLVASNQDPDSKLNFVILGRKSNITGVIDVKSELYKGSTIVAELKLPKLKYEVWASLNSIVARITGTAEDLETISSFRMSTSRTLTGEKKQYDFIKPINTSSTSLLVVEEHTMAGTNYSRLTGDKVNVKLKPLLEFGYGEEQILYVTVLDDDYEPKPYNKTHNLPCGFKASNLYYEYSQASAPDFCYQLCRKKPQCKAWVALNDENSIEFHCQLYSEADMEVGTLNTPHFGGPGEKGELLLISAKKFAPVTETFAVAASESASAIIDKSFLAANTPQRQEHFASGLLTINLHGGCKIESLCSLKSVHCPNVMVGKASTENAKRQPSAKQWNSENSFDNNYLVLD